MSWVKRVEAVLNVLKGSSIEEVELSEGGFEIIVHRRPGHIISIAQQPHTAQPPPVNHHTTGAATIKAPLTGVYYATPSPDAEPFVKVGEHVTIGQTIALIEAMKVFNEIQAEIAGKVTAIQVQHGEVVKKDQVILQIVPA